MLRTTRRKRKVTFNEPGHAHYLTFSCYRRLPLLGSDRTRMWFVEALASACRRLGFAIWAYVIMPEHVHVLVYPLRPDCRVERLLAAVKRPVSTAAKAYLEETGNHDWLARLTVREGKQTVFRFWQAGGGYDRNLWNRRPIQEVIEYIHNNPVRRGLVKNALDWKWSSARFWAGHADVPLTMEVIEY